jgi:hypothetical protein
MPAWTPAFETDLSAAFAAEPFQACPAYELAFRYLLTGFMDRLDRHGARVFHPGAGSWFGRSVAGFESFARTAPLLAAWLAGGRAHMVEDLRGRRLDLPALLHRGLTVGAKLTGPGAWGQIKDYDQRIIEAADIARVLILQPHLFSGAERQAILDWLDQANHVRHGGRNILLSLAFLNQAIAHLHDVAQSEPALSHYHAFSAFYAGDGWYSDGPGARFDFYNAWAIHYELFWLRWLKPDFGGPELTERMRAFAQSFAHLISPKGLPILGRSICYRLAAPAPLIAAHLLHAQRGIDLGVSSGRAQRSLNAVWRRFIARGALANGNVTQGYCGADLRFLDAYSSQGSCLWSLRSLTLALLAPPDAPFWTEAEHPLPVEAGDFTLALPALDWVVTGDRQTGDIRIHQKGSLVGAPIVYPQIQPYSWPLRLLAWLAPPWGDFLGPYRLRGPFRPKNTAAKYEAPVYSALAPFCGCDWPKR